MKRHYLHPSIIEAMNLSGTERKVFDALLSIPVASTISQIARLAGVPRSTTAYVLLNLQKRNVAIPMKKEKRTKWKYNKWLSYVNRNFNEPFTIEERQKARKKKYGSRGGETSLLTPIKF